MLGHASTADETVEIIAALIQLYREQGYYLERIYKWARRVGTETARAAVMDDKAQRKMLYDRFVFSQKFSQTDPWAERVRGAEAHEFQPLASLPRLEAAE